MPIRFSGEFEVKQEPQEVYQFLVDPHRFASLLPDFQGLTIHDATHFTLRVKVGISHIKGTAEVKMVLAEATSPCHAQYRGQGVVAGGSVTVQAGFDLAPAGAGTRVSWQGEAQIFGRLTSVGGGLLEPLGRKQAHKLIDGLQAALGTLVVPVQAQAPPVATEGLPPDAQAAASCVAEQLLPPGEQHSPPPTEPLPAAQVERQEP